VAWTTTLIPLFCARSQSCAGKTGLGFGMALSRVVLDLGADHRCRVSFAGNRSLRTTGARRVLTSLLAPPFNPKLMTIDMSACGFGFIFASHIQRLLRLAALTLADNVFMLPPAKIVDQGLIAVQKYLRPSVNVTL
jgi:hypothetical protein